VGDAAQVVPELEAAWRRQVSGGRRRASLASQINSDKHRYLQKWLDHDSGSRVNPGRFFRSLDANLPDDAIVVADDGNHTFMVAELLPMSGHRTFISPTDFNCMGYCVPAATGASLANPDRLVCGVVGDGGLVMTGFEALTAVSNGIGVIWFVFADGELSQIAQAQQVTMNRKTCTVLPPVDVEAFAKSVGAQYINMGANRDVDACIKKAALLARDKKAVFVRVNIDYSKRTQFTSGAVKTNFGTFDMATKLRLAGRSIYRKFSH